MLTFKEFRQNLHEATSRITVIGDKNYKPRSYADILYKELFTRFNGKEMNGTTTMLDLLKPIDLLGFKVIKLSSDKSNIDNFMFGSPDDFIIKLLWNKDTKQLSMDAGTGSDTIPEKFDKQKTITVVHKVDKIILGTYGEYIYKQLSKTFEGKPELDITQFETTLKRTAFANHKMITNTDGSFSFKGISTYPPTFDCKIYYKNGTVTLYAGLNFNSKIPKETSTPSKDTLDYAKEGGLKGRYKIQSRNFFNN